MSQFYRSMDNLGEYCQILGSYFAAYVHNFANSFFLFCLYVPVSFCHHLILSAATAFYMYS